MNDTDTSISVVNESFKDSHFPNITLCQGDANATSVMEEPVQFSGAFSTSLRIGNNVAFHDFYVASGFQHHCVLGTDFLFSVGISNDMSHWSLKWESETTLLATDPQNLYWDVSLLERVEIPQRSEVFLILPVSPE